MGCEADMKFKQKREITDNSSDHGFVRIKIGIDPDMNQKLKIIAVRNDTFVSEIIRAVMEDFLKDYDDNGNPINEETGK